MLLWPPALTRVQAFLAVFPNWVDYHPKWEANLAKVAGTATFIFASFYAP
jgi:hypothetical protein